MENEEKYKQEAKNTFYSLLAVCEGIAIVAWFILNVYLVIQIVHLKEPDIALEALSKNLTTVLFLAFPLLYKPIKIALARVVEAAGLKFSPPTQPRETPPEAEVPIQRDPNKTGEEK